MNGKLISESLVILRAWGVLAERDAKAHGHIGRDSLRFGTQNRNIRQEIAGIAPKMVARLFKVDDSEAEDIKRDWMMWVSRSHYVFQDWKAALDKYMPRFQQGGFKARFEKKAPVAERAPEKSPKDIAAVLTQLKAAKSMDQVMDLVNQARQFLTGDDLIDFHQKMKKSLGMRSYAQVVHRMHSQHTDEGVDSMINEKALMQESIGILRVWGTLGEEEKGEDATDEAPGAHKGKKPDGNDGENKAPDHGLDQEESRDLGGFRHYHGVTRRGEERVPNPRGTGTLVRKSMAEKIKLKMRHEAKQKRMEAMKRAGKVQTEKTAPKKKSVKESTSLDNSFYSRLDESRDRISDGMKKLSKKIRESA